MSEELPQDSTPAVESTPVESSSAPEPVEQTSTENVSPEPTQSVWDSFKGLPDFEGQDDRSIAQSLYESFEREKAATRSLQQYQQLIPYAQEYLDNKEAFEQYKQGQAQPSKFSNLRLLLRLKNRSHGGIRQRLSRSISAILYAMRMGERRLPRMLHWMRVTQ